MYSKFLLNTQKEIMSARKSRPMVIKKSNLGPTPTNVIYVDFKSKKRV